MIWLWLLAIPLWFVFGYFAVRMNILYNIDQNKNWKTEREVINQWTPVIFIAGPISWVMFIIDPTHGLRCEAHYIPKPKVPVPSERLVMSWFGVRR